MEGVVFFTRRCQRCDGTGLVPDQTGGHLNGSCDRCDGSGSVTWDSIDLSDFVNKFDDILNKLNDILEKLNE